MLALENSVPYTTLRHIGHVGDSDVGQVSDFSSVGRPKKAATQGCPAADLLPRAARAAVALACLPGRIRTAQGWSGGGG